MHRGEDKQDNVPHIAWLKSLPKSKIVYPEKISHRMKYHFWRVYTPYHPRVRDRMTALRIVLNHGRQPYALGTIAPHYSIEEFVDFLLQKGYAHHRVAWVDHGEVVSLRYLESFMYQYHIRIFENREVRGHYEFTPECYPLRHLFDVGRQDRRNEFLKLFGERIIPHTFADQASYRWEILPLRRRLWEKTLRALKARAARTRSNTDQK